LFKLLEKGDVDAMINISSFTVQAAAQPDKFRSVFSVNDCLPATLYGFPTSA